jgi:hypothetical protein
MEKNFSTKANDPKPTKIIKLLILAFPSAEPSGPKGSGMIWINASPSKVPAANEIKQKIIGLKLKHFSFKIIKTTADIKNPNKLTPMDAATP